MREELFQVRCRDRSGEHDYSVALVQEFGRHEIDAGVVRDLWAEVSQHPVLFSEEVGDVENFILMFLDPRSVWMTITRETDHRLVGAMYMTDVILGNDAECHVAFFDTIASGRERLVHVGLAWCFDRYHLRRVTSEIPPYQTGTIRFVKKLGFSQEGERRAAIMHKGSIMSLLIFGMLRDELMEVVNVANRENGVRNSSGDSGISNSSGETYAEPAAGRV